MRGCFVSGGTADDSAAADAAAVPPMGHPPHTPSMGRDAAAVALFGALPPGCLPALRKLDLDRNHLGGNAAEAIAAALRRGAMPKLKT